jgi:diguanylate cyclase (GGDEF)-like protein
VTELAVAIGILWALFFSCVTIAIALGIAWAQFNHPRYALSWALAFAMNAVQTVINVAASLTGPNQLLMTLAFGVLMISSPLVAIGVRHRAGLPVRRGRYLAIGLLVFAYVVVTERIPVLEPYSDPAATIYSGLVLLEAALMLRPRAPRNEVAEWALAGSLGVVAVLELIVAGLTCAWDASGHQPQIGLVYHGLLVAVVPPFVIASGVSAVLLVASDLALQLRRIAACDPLTGLYNRRGFQELAVQAIQRAHASRQPVSLVIGDIDHFKRINDDHGHAVGDQTLILVGRRLSAGAGADDLVGRIGGEEFALLMLDSRGYEAAQTMDRIRTDIATGHPDAGDAEAEPAPHAVTVSFGIAEVGTDGTIEAMLADALDRADRALYRSKVAGRDRVTLASANDPERDLLPDDASIA